MKIGNLSLYEQLKNCDRTVYIDVDGTITAFNPDAGPDLWAKDDYIWMCEVLENMVTAIKHIINSYANVKFLSASVSDAASEQKRRFLRTLFGDLPEDMIVIVPYGRRKADFVDPTKGLLLDDYSVNCIQWEEDGGKAIKVRNNCNSKHGKWRGSSVHYKQTPESIARMVLMEALF